MPISTQEARRRWREAAVESVTRCGEHLLGEGQRLAPIEEGTLRDSGDLDVEVRGNVVTATVSFNTVYAARQHEETEWNHPLGGQAKYLEQPLRENASRYKRIIEAAERRAMN